MAVVEPITAARLVPLTEAVELNPRPDRATLSDDLEVSFVPMAAVEAATGRMDTSTVRPFGNVKKGYTVFRDGDVLFAKITPCMENGKMAVARGLRSGVGCGSTEFHVLRTRPGVDPNYVYHFVSSARFRADAAHQMTGAVGQKRVPVAFFERCEIPLPELDEQRLIVAEIEKQFSRLDEAVASLKRVKASLARYEQAVLRNAVAFGADGDREMSRLPAGWEWRSLSDLGELSRGKSRHRPRDDPRLYGSPYPFVQTGDVRRSGGVIREFSQRYSVLGLEQSRLWPAGTLCITIAANIAETGILAMPACFPDSVVGFLSDDQTLTRYVELFMRTAREELERFAPATAQKNINLAVLERVLVPVPPVAERERIVAEVDRRLSIVREVEAEIDANLKRAQALRQAVLQRVFASADGGETMALR
jgi:type I restriction enzyme S subunit